MRLIAYWKCVVLRLVDVLALHVRYAVRKLVDNELESEILNEVVGGARNGIEKMLEESPSTAGKRERLRKSIQMLKESKEVNGIHLTFQPGQEATHCWHDSQLACGTPRWLMSSNKGPTSQAIFLPEPPVDNNSIIPSWKEGHICYNIFDHQLIKRSI
ncbi:Dynamin-related protein 4C [Platanthera guangdongensis]|uniref:Dynamin-related protein 4C n=1 Tax=Platanthera guangdongensis TaxID=2320717 RepID=A0ABR2N580_9ASPA